MNKGEIKEILERASAEVQTWPNWMRSPDVESARKQLHCNEASEDSKIVVLFFIVATKLCHGS